MDSRSDFVSLVNYAGQYVNHQVQNSELSGKFNIQNEAILQAMSRALQDLRSAIVQNLTGSRGID